MAEGSTMVVGGQPGNKHKNRYPDILPCEPNKEPGFSLAQYPDTNGAGAEINIL